MVTLSTYAHAVEAVAREAVNELACDAIRFAFECMKVVIELNEGAELPALLQKRAPHVTEEPRRHHESAAATSTPLATVSYFATMLPQATYLPKLAALSCTLTA